MISGQVMATLRSCNTCSAAAIGQLTSRRFTAPGEQELREDFAYNARGERTSSTRYGTVNGSWQVGLSTFSYDAAGNQTGITHLDSSSAVIAKYTYTYDLAQQLTAENLAGTIKTYTYDAAGQVTGDGVTTYVYDNAG